MITDLIVTNEALVQTALGIGVVAVGLVVLLSVVAGFRLAWTHFEHHLTEWATADVRERNKDLIAQLAEKDREIERLNHLLRLKDERVRGMLAAVRGAQVQVGTVAEVLTLSELEAM